MLKNIKRITVIIAFFILCGMPLDAKAGSEFIHTHGEECKEIRVVPCVDDAVHTRSSSHEIITRHCEYCQKMTEHSHYLTNYYCSLTGYSKTTEGKTACLTCHNLGYAWKDSNGFSHTKEETYYICGVEDGEAVARVHISPDKTELTNQDVLLNASVEIIHANLAGNQFSYSFDGNNWSGNPSISVSQNGNYTVHVKNSEGAVADASVSITNIDKIAPVISSISHDESGMTKEQISVTIVATDENGIGGFSFDGGASWQESGTFQIKEGNTYTVVVKDKAGNTVSKSINRSQFPYPYVPPVQSKPQPSQESRPSKEPQPSSKPQQSSKSQQKSSSAKEQGKIASSKKKNVDEKRKEVEEIQTEKDMEGLVPKISMLESIQTKEKMENQFGDQQLKEKERAQMLTNTFDINNGTNTNDEKELHSEILLEPSEKETGINNRVWVIGGVFIGLVILYFIYLFQTVALYTMEEIEGDFYFRRLSRIRIKKTENGYRAVLPKKIYEYSAGKHFRILLSPKWLKEGKNKQIFIYNGRRKFVAEMEECIDFVL